MFTKENKKEIINAIKQGNQAKIFESLKGLEPADINEPLFGNTSILMMASHAGLNEVVQYVCDKFKDNLEIDKATKYGSALFSAIDGNHPDVVQTLIDAGANVNLRLDNGATALGIANTYFQDGIAEKLKAVHAQEVLPQWDSIHLIISYEGQLSKKEKLMRYKL